MLSEIIESDWLWALSAEIAEDNAPVRLMIELRIRSRRDADNVAGADGDTVHDQRRRRTRGVDAGDGSGDGGIIEHRVAGGIGRGDRDAVLTAVGELGAARVLAVPGEGIRTGIAGAGAAPHRVAGRILDADRDVGGGR